MPQMGFEPMIPVCELEKTIRALDSAATVINSFTNITLSMALEPFCWTLAGFSDS
jgi:hypothetical protein